MKLRKTYNIELNITSNVVITSEYYLWTNVDLSNYSIDAILNVYNISDYHVQSVAQHLMFNYNVNSKKLMLNGYIQPIKIKIYYLSENMERKEKLERILKI